MTLGEFLKNKRIEKGYSLRKLEEITKINNSTLSQYENHNVIPTLKNALLIFKELNIDIKEIEKILLQE